MKLIRTVDAAGQVLCHDITQIIPGEYKDARFRKGHVIQPEDTRPWLVKALEVSLTKRVDGPPRKHGNIPL